MNRSADITILLKALIAAKKAFKPLEKNNLGQFGTSRKYKYADLAAVKESYQEALTANDLTVIHTLRERAGHMVLTTTLMHVSDQWYASDYPLKVYDKPQEQGSAVTYATRYNVKAVLDLVAEGDDDDGAAAQDSTPKKVKAEKPAPKPEDPARPPSELTRDEIMAVCDAAKAAGIRNGAELKPFLFNGWGLEKAGEIPKALLAEVLESLSRLAEKREEVIG